MRSHLALLLVSFALVALGCSRATGDHAQQTAESAQDDIDENMRAASRDLDQAGHDLSETARRANANVQSGIDQAAAREREATADLARQRGTDDETGEP